MDVVGYIHQKARSLKKTIALPEYADKRVIEGANMVEKEGLANVLLVTPDVVDKNLKEKYIEEVYKIRQAKGADLESVRKLFDDTLFYAAMLVQEGLADGFVAGAAHTTADVCRAALYCIGVDARLMVASSSFIMCMPNHPLVPDGALLYADCGLIPEPTPRQLACIAVATAELGQKVLGLTPRVGFLSFSTKGSAKHKLVDKVIEAVGLVKEIDPNLLCDGELQADSAIVPEVAKIKCASSAVAGKANVLIFPNLESGNICYKLTERLAGARALGPLLMGFKRPCSDLSRGCSAQDVMDCVAVTAIRAV
jgi:phosphate acetyltransferase